MDKTKFTSFDDPGSAAICGEARQWVENIGRPKKCYGDLSPAKQAALVSQYEDTVIISSIIILRKTRSTFQAVTIIRGKGG